MFVSSVDPLTTTDDADAGGATATGAGDAAGDARGSTELTLARYSYVPHKREGKIIDGRVQTIAWIWLVPHRPSP